MPSRSGLILPLLIVVASAAGPAVQAADTILVPTGAVWRYLDNGSNQGTAWRGVGFNDSSWAQGPAELGYGDGDEATVVSLRPATPRSKFITTYFRRAFQANGVAALLDVATSASCATTAPSSTSTASRCSAPTCPAAPITFTTLARPRSAARTRRRSSRPRCRSVAPGRRHQRARGRDPPVGPHQHRHQLRPRAGRDATASASRAVPTCSSARPTRASSCAGAPTPRPTAASRYGTTARQPRPSRPTTPRSRPSTWSSSTGLDPATRYYYAVGTATEILAGGDAEHSFVTAPLAGDAAADPDLGARRLGHRQRQRRRGARRVPELDRHARRPTSG